MSLDITLSIPNQCPNCSHDIYDGNTIVFDWNITHNLTTMADNAGLYFVIWRPEERNYKYAKDIIEPLESGLNELLSNKDKYTKYNPKNGWGSYETLVNTVENYLSACKQYPNSVIKVNR